MATLWISPNRKGNSSRQFSEIYHILSSCLNHSLMMNYMTKKSFINWQVGCARDMYVQGRRRAVIRENEESRWEMILSVLIGYFHNRFLLNANFRQPFIQPRQDLIFIKHLKISKYKIQLTRWKYTSKGQLQIANHIKVIRPSSSLPNKLWVFPISTEKPTHMHNFSLKKVSFLLL